MRFLTLMVAVLSTAVGAAAQDVTVQAAVDKQTLNTREQVTFTIEVAGASFSGVETPDPPITKGLALTQSAPSMQRNISVRNGQVQQRMTFRWTYRPLREGAARIAGVRLRVEGQSYRTDPIRLKVVSPSQQPSRGRRPARATGSRNQPDDAGSQENGANEKDLFIRAMPSSRQVYQNEQVTITYRLYFRSGIQVRQSRMADSWNAAGFWREDLEVDTRPVPHTTVMNGQRYKMITLKRVAVFPTRAGQLRVDPLRIETEAYVPNASRNSSFSQFFFGNDFESIELASPPVSIDVQSLPRNAPAAFNGAVSSFRLNATMDRERVEVGEPVEVTVRLRGVGNLATLEAPTLEVPDAFETYDPETQMDIKRRGRRIRGSKTFTYVLVPRSGGTYALPPVQLAYFDPAVERYRTLTDELPRLRVTGTAPAPAHVTRTGLPANDIAGLITDAGTWRQADRTPLHRVPWTYAALGVPLLALLGVYAYHRRATRWATDVAYRRQRQAHPVARRHLKQARRLLKAGDQRAFYAEVHRAVMSFIGNRLNVAERALTRSQITHRLADAGVSGRTRTALRQLLADSDEARFAPAPHDRTAMKATLNRAEKMIAALDKAFS